MPYELLLSCSNKKPFTRLWTKEFSNAKFILERIAYFGNVGDMHNTAVVVRYVTYVRLSREPSALRKNYTVYSVNVSFLYNFY